MTDFSWHDRERRDRAIGLLENLFGNFRSELLRVVDYAKTVRRKTLS